MIISASRRTDIPAFYAGWLINRLNAGYCLVKNPFNPKQIRRVSLLPKDVDGIVLWTKNAAPLLSDIFVLDAFPYYFQYSVTAYGSDIERGLADKKSVIIPAFIKFAEHIGAERMIWRYDPILITDKYDFAYHARAFDRLCELLAGNTKKCVVSFAVPYKSVAKKMREAGHREFNIQEKVQLAQTLLTIAASHEITLCACCELPELFELGVQPVSCVDAALFDINAPRDKYQRNGCNCAVSVDIGAYNSCMNGCIYCYANHAEAAVRQNHASHNLNGELLI